jgi:sulfhydrogenase subunit alpha
MSHGKGGWRSIGVGELARVEGEGALRVEVRDGSVRDVRLEIFEPPRYFEALLRGRSGSEAPDITARICGICPVAYQMSACAAIEDACGVEPGPDVVALRRLLYCGEWIQSHALHVYLLHAPDFHGCDDAVQLAELDRAAVERGLRLKRAGNLLMEVIGGRAVHPVNVRVGGFYRAPSPVEVRGLTGALRAARDDALATVDWVNRFEFPDVERDYRFVALRHPDRYAVEAGRVTSSDGIDLSPGAFAELAVEEQVPHSTALHARIDGRSYLTGPLARYALNRDKLPQVAREAASAAGLAEECRNPFKSIVVRAVELVFACEEALALIERYEPPSPPAVQVPRREGRGAGATEAPRGLLVHTYHLDGEGLIRQARIMPPTSQNQLSIEEDLRQVVTGALELPDDQLTRLCEQAVRNHDPCISCAAHFLDLVVERSRR